ncbi:MAG: nucleotidyltransferase domain-containing protein [bacterium]
MLYENEIKILSLLLENLEKEYTIREISLALKQKYPQTHRSISALSDKGLINLRDVGKSKVVNLDFAKYHPEFAIVEQLRAIKFQHITEQLSEMKKPFCCILFGSHARRKAKKTSDLDLLFILPEEYNQETFEKQIFGKLALYNPDINIISGEDLLKSWQKKELNVGNELLMAHLVLYGADYFISLLRRKHGY